MYWILLFILIALIVTFAYAARQGAPWVPTKKMDVERFLNLARIQPGEKMYDLGCGDGRLVCAAARSGARAEGLELSLAPFLLAHLRRLGQKDKNRIKFSFQDFWRKNFSDADLVYLFLTPHIYPQLKEKLEKELRPGTKVVAYVWPVEGWLPVQIDAPPGQPKIHLYQI